jgi:hypothetical protein
MQLGEIDENLTSLHLAEKSRVLTNMVLRGRVAPGVITHFDSYTSSSTRVVYQAKCFASKQDIYQVGLIPKRSYTEVPLYLEYN